MKNFNNCIALLFLLSAGVLLGSCSDKPLNNENDDVTFQSSLENLQYFPSSRTELILSSLSQKDLSGWSLESPIPLRIRDHVGTHLFQNCNGSNPCGPCPGICLRFGKIAGDIMQKTDSLSTQDYQSGLRVYSLSIIQNNTTNEEKVLFETQYDTDLLNQGSLYITQKTPVADDITSALNKTSISIKPGIYQAFYQSNIAYTILDVDMN